MEEKGTFKKVELEKDIVEQADQKHLGGSDNQESMSEQIKETSDFQEESSQGDQLIKTGFFDDLTNLFTAPSVLMESLSRRPKMLAPFSLIFGIGALTALLSKRSYINFMLEYTRQQNPALDPNMIKGQIESSYLGSIIGSSLGGIIACLIFAVVFLLIGKLMRGEGAYKPILSTLAYSSVISSLGGFLVGIGKLLTGNFFFDFSPAMLFGEKVITDPVFSLLALLNPFYIWYFIVATIGIAKAHQIDRKKSAILVVGITIFVQVFFIFVGLMLKGMTGQ